MAKKQVAELWLVQTINSELEAKWIHKPRTCRVDRLKHVLLPDGNWQVDIDSSGGPDLLHVGECDKLLTLILANLSSKYDVKWA